jgi:hypothetical protein
MMIEIPKQQCTCAKLDTVDSRAALLPCRKWWRGCALSRALNPDLRHVDPTVYGLVLQSLF